MTVLSQYGMFFRTMEPRPVNTCTRVTVSFSDRTVDVEAVVLYIVSFEEGPFCEPGMGMKFQNITSLDRDVIQAHIREHVRPGIPPDSGP